MNGGKAGAWRPWITTSGGPSIPCCIASCVSRCRVAAVSDDVTHFSSVARCSASGAATLQRDTQLAMQHGIEGTPLVVINGRQAPAFPPFIYAMIIAAGDSNAAGFRILPPPRPESLEK